jgi:hypothetical protein
MPKSPDPTIAVLRYVKDAITNVNGKISTNNCHAQELREAESKRIDANRAGDLTALSVKAAQDQLTIKDLSDRVLELERTQSQNVGRSSIWTNPLIVALVSVITGFLIAKYFK